MPTLYVNLQGSRIEKEYKRLIVTKHDEIVLRVPIQRVSEVVLVGRVGVTTPALHSLLTNGVMFLMVTRSGKLKGRLQPPTAFNLPLRQQQYRLNDSFNFCLDFSRQIVQGKIDNQRTYALRLARQNKIINNSCEKELLNLHEQSEKATSIAELMGIEGLAAKKYFSVYKKGFDPSWHFTNRNRRPPRDPINVLPSLGYTFLGYAIISALEIVGLDPYLGFFHAEKYGRPALMLDMIEEFRVPIVDSLVYSLINREMIHDDDFEYFNNTEGLLLSEKGMNIFLTSFSKKLEAEIKLRKVNRKLSYRKIFEIQARKLVDTIEGKRQKYTPFKMR